MNGFATTFAPAEGSGRLVWRTVCGAGGLASLVLLVRILIASVRADARRSGR